MPNVTVNVSNGTPSVEMLVQNGSSVFARTAERLQTARQIALTGDVLGDAMFDGSQNANIFTAVEKLTNEELERMLI